jgi:hypothetical protein
MLDCHRGIRQGGEVCNTTYEKGIGEEMRLDMYCLNPDFHTAHVPHLLPCLGFGGADCHIQIILITHSYQISLISGPNLELLLNIKLVCQFCSEFFKLGCWRYHYVSCVIFEMHLYSYLRLSASSSTGTSCALFTLRISGLLEAVLGAREWLLSPSPEIGLIISRSVPSLSSKLLPPAPSGSSSSKMLWWPALYIRLPRRTYPLAELELLIGRSNLWSGDERIP